ncbi:MAG: hypothetical protein U0746_04930 [Gemmataceae bacterium]
MLADAIARYHDLLTDAVAADSQAVLEARTRDAGLYFGERPVCTVLRPRFLTPDQFQFLRRRMKALVPAFQRAYSVALTDATFRAQFGLREIEETLFAADPGFPDPSPTARYDAFFVSDRELKFTENNAETPAGAGYNDALTDVFYSLPVVRAFSQRYLLRPLPARTHILNALLGTYEQWRGHRSSLPKIAIFDWEGVPTVSEFRIFQSYFASHGLECGIFTPEQATYEGGKLRVGDYVIDLIYKRVLISELLEKGGLTHPIVRAVLDGAVCMVNAFRCKLLYKKASFAVLSDERNADLFAAEQRQAIADHIPWTRVVVERSTEFCGQTIDLVPYIAANRETFVLKPNDEYGGKGIVLGWTVDQPAWEAAVRHALTEPYVVQEKVGLPHEDYPSFHNGKVHLIDRVLDTNPYVGPSGTMDACLTRISTEALVNVTAGGGSTVPTFTIDER